MVGISGVLVTDVAGRRYLNLEIAGGWKRSGFSDQDGERRTVRES
jgi:hypothetical protein